MSTTLYPHSPHRHSLPWQPVSWDWAPHWARWAAMDRTGNWFWYEDEPKDEDGYFHATTGKVAQFTHLPCPTYWRLSLQHRPEKEEFFFSSAEYAYDHLQP